MMNFELTEEQTLYSDTVRSFLSVRYSVQKRTHYLAQAHGYDRSNWAKLADLGVLALPFSAKMGGLGGTAKDVAVVQEEIGYHLAVEPFADNIAIPAIAFDWFENHDLAKSLTEKIVSGDMTITVALAEDRDISGMDNRRCRAKVTADRVVLAGSKPIVAYPSADLLLVSAETGKAADQQTVILLLVPADTPGVAINRYQLIDGTPAASIEFDNVKLPDTAVVVGTDRAGRAIEGMYRMGAHAAVAECLGILHRMFELTAKYMSDRVQFGKPLSHQQVVRHRLAEMKMHYELAQSVVAGLGLYKAETAAGLRQLSAAKVTIAQAFEFIGKQSIQLHGGIGLTDEYELSHYYKRALVLQDSYGSKREHSLRLARLEAA